LTDALLKTGDTLANRYELGDPIATGAAASIYLARSVYLGIPVAVKVLHRDLATNLASRMRFRREAHLAAQIAHPNIVTVLDFGQTDEGLPFLVMEHVSGRSLAEVVRVDGPQPLARVVSLVRQLGAALDELHAAGIAHGDVKPDNLVVRPDRNGADSLKLVDFGRASELAWAATESPSPTGVCGTPGYVAPEVIQGAPVSAAADVYAAGVVLYELVTGANPFADPSPRRTLERQVAGDFVPASVLRPELGLPAALDHVVATALDPDPARRPTVAALGTTLASMAHGEPVAAEPVVRPGPSRTDRLREAIGRALRSGEIDRVAELYLGLATLLRAIGDAPTAEAELAEAVDIVTLGAGSAATSGPDDLWRLLMLLGELQAWNGRPAAARASLAHAYHHAVRVGSDLGRKRAEELARIVSLKD
jgi:serine/threonine-protein kinase